MLTGEFRMRKRAVVSTAATVQPSKPLGSFLFGLAVLVRGSVRVACEALC